jgi:hypothetical protein
VRSTLAGETPSNDAEPELAIPSRGSAKAASSETREADVERVEVVADVRQARRGGVRLLHAEAGIDEARRARQAVAIDHADGVAEGERRLCRPLRRHLGNEQVGAGLVRGGLGVQRCVS